MTQKEVPFKWDNKWEEGSKKLKTLLTLASKLILPFKGKDFILYCDDLYLGLGVVLM